MVPLERSKRDNRDSTKGVVGVCVLKIRRGERRRGRKMEGDGEIEREKERDGETVRWREKGERGKAERGHATGAILEGCSH